MKLSKTQIIRCFECYAVFVLSIGVGYALVMVVTVAIMGWRIAQFETIWARSDECLPGSPKQYGRQQVWQFYSLVVWKSVSCSQCY